MSEAAAKKREKQEDALAKQKIKDQIAADKENRRLKAEREKAERAGQAPPPTPAATPVVAQVGSKPASSYKETRMRLQTPGGTITKIFPVETTLFEVAAAVKQEAGGFEASSFTQNFPKKTPGFGRSLIRSRVLAPRVYKVPKRLHYLQLAVSQPARPLRVMPAQGEQHQSASKPNPFEESKPHVSEYTASEIATLSSRLEKQLGPEYISSRPGAGGAKVHYLAADKCINLANQALGFNGWSSSIQQIQIDFVDENQSTGRDIGYGHIENCKGKAPAFEKAKKEGTTDGLKRALRNFGNLLGNCVYDKDFVARVTKLKAAPTKWDPENLHRHQAFSSIKREYATDDQHPQLNLPNRRPEPSLVRQESREDEFGSDDFDEVDFAVPEGDDPDGVALDQNLQSEHFQPKNDLSSKRSAQANRMRPPSPLASKQGAVPGAELPTTGQVLFNRPNTTPRPVSNTHAPLVGNSATAQLPPLHLSNENMSNSKSSDSSSHEAPIGFYTARAAESLQNAPGPLQQKVPAFNPHLESPSIRKTAGVDHSQTKPVSRNIDGAPVPNVPPIRGLNVPNQQADKARRVGMPTLASPLQNRGSYKPPQMKRPAEGDGGNRCALGDVTELSVNMPVVNSNGDIKRPRLGARSPDIVTVDSNS
ncbi:uncharacterized protein KY384_006921 [Bacidia gigantensis]|uniref:uncharacterized protein n=1 Tax=Bacidia gigantensis TaxID=2732470 RepID=UPI001D0513FB|nr:uncharacterized protein KY384_006921 [Bacidia gigantensis]KAG8528005.1 hypothetical protein KY384_006921 [Bacidia gigantensis]